MSITPPAAPSTPTTLEVDISAITKKYTGQEAMEFIGALLKAYEGTIIPVGSGSNMHEQIKQHNPVMPVKK